MGSKETGEQQVPRGLGEEKGSNKSWGWWWPGEEQDGDGEGFRNEP